jgi:hypothetical protein
MCRAVLGSYSELNTCLEAKTKEFALEEERTYMLEKDIRGWRDLLQEEVELDGPRAELAAMEKKNKVCL